MTPDKQPKARFPTENEFLTERLSQERPPRLAVRVVMNLAQAPGNIAQALDAGPQGGHASAALLASLLHDGVLSVEQIKQDLLGRGFNIRPLA